MFLTFQRDVHNNSANVKSCLKIIFNVQFLTFVFRLKTTTSMQTVGFMGKELLRTKIIIVHPLLKQVSIFIRYHKMSHLTQK